MIIECSLLHKKLLINEIQAWDNKMINPTTLDNKIHL